MFASKLHRLATASVLFCQNGDKSGFICVFLVISKNVNYGLVIVIRFCH